MKSIKSKLFENFSSDEVSNINKVIGGSGTATQYWVNTVTHCENGLTIADASLETDINGSKEGVVVSGRVGHF